MGESSTPGADEPDAKTGASLRQVCAPEDRGKAWDADTEVCPTRWVYPGAKRNHLIAPPGVVDGVKEPVVSECEPDAVTSATTGASRKVEEPAAEYDPDTATGATPGVANACKDLGMFSPEDVSRQLGIKPPGQL